jgi:hypothetical protein
LGAVYWDTIVASPFALVACQMSFESPSHLKKLVAPVGVPCRYPGICLRAQCKAKQMHILQSRLHPATRAPQVRIHPHRHTLGGPSCGKESPVRDHDGSDGGNHHPELGRFSRDEGLPPARRAERHSLKSPSPSTSRHSAYWRATTSTTCSDATQESSGPGRPFHTSMQTAAFSLRTVECPAIPSQPADQLQ